MTLEVTKTVLNKMMLNVWIENGPILSKQSRPQLRCGTRLERCEQALHLIE
jgi:hypothetical protein